MAKVTGGLLSLDASGTFGGAITYAKWKGRQYARIKGNPSNPKTIGQMTGRAYFAAGGKITKRADLTDDVVTYVKTILPAGQSWASYFVKEMLGSGNVNIEAAQTAYNTGGNATVKGYFDDAAGQAGIEAVNIGSETYEQLPAGLALWAAYMASFRLNDPAAPVTAASASEAQVFAYTDALTGVTPT